MTEEQYMHGDRIQKIISDETARKQRITDLLEDLEEVKVKETQWKTLDIVCIDKRMRTENRTAVRVDEGGFEKYLREEIDRINQKITDLQEEFHGI